MTKISRDHSSALWLELIEEIQIGGEEIKIGIEEV